MVKSFTRLPPFRYLQPTFNSAWLAKNFRASYDLLRFNNMLEQFTEFTEGAILMIIGTDK